MSTSAIVNFVNDRVPVAVYVRPDGSEIGIALALHNTLKIPAPGSMAERFIRANPNAIITNSTLRESLHTHFVYTLARNDRLIVDNGKETLFEGSMYDFINKRDAFSGMERWYEIVAPDEGEIHACNTYLLHRIKEIADRLFSLFLYSDANSPDFKAEKALLEHFIRIYIEKSGTSRYDLLCELKKMA